MALTDEYIFGWGKGAYSRLSVVVVIRGGGWRLGSGVVDVHVLLEGVLFSKLFGLSILRVKIFRCTQE